MIKTRSSNLVNNAIHETEAVTRDQDCTAVRSPQFQRQQPKRKNTVRPNSSRKDTDSGQEVPYTDHT